MFGRSRTFADTLAIHRAYGTYARCIDTGDIDGWMTLWTSDGELHGNSVYLGHDALAAFAKTRSQRLAADGWANVIHHVGNLELRQLGRSHAVGSCSVIRLGIRSETGELRLASVAMSYDEIVKVKGQWRFRRRRLTSVTPSDDAPPGWKN